MAMESTRTTAELLVANPNWAYFRTDRNETRYFTDCTCHRCGGKGIIPCYGYIDGGICFECGGSGITSRPEVIKVYTPEYAAKLAQQRAAKAEKAAAERAAKAIAERSTKLEKLGFTQEEQDGRIEWVIYRVVGNTYAIKDELKAAGCHFNAAVGWYKGAPVEDHECQRMTEHDVLRPDVFVIWKDASEVKSLWVENQRAAASPSEWQGSIGASIIVTLVVDRVIGFDGRFGTSYMHIMHDAAGNIYKWMTAKQLEEGQSYCLKATVKDHTEYNNIKQTVITRASLVKD